MQAVHREGRWELIFLQPLVASLLSTGYSRLPIISPGMDTFRVQPPRENIQLMLVAIYIYISVYIYMYTHLSIYRYTSLIVLHLGTYRNSIFFASVLSGCPLVPHYNDFHRATGRSVLQCMGKVHV